MYLQYRGKFPIIKIVMKKYSNYAITVTGAKSLEVEMLHAHSMRRRGRRGLAYMLQKTISRTIFIFLFRGGRCASETPPSPIGMRDKTQTGEEKTNRQPD
jgi:hypothetical protein